MEYLKLSLPNYDIFSFSVNIANTMSPYRVRPVPEKPQYSLEQPRMAEKQCQNNCLKWLLF